MAGVAAVVSEPREEERTALVASNRSSRKEMGRRRGGVGRRISGGVGLDKVPVGLDLKLLLSENVLYADLEGVGRVIFRGFVRGVRGDLRYYTTEKPFRDEGCVDFDSGLDVSFQRIAKLEDIPSYALTKS